MLTSTFETQASESFKREIFGKPSALFLRQLFRKSKYFLSNFLSFLEGSLW